MAHPDQSRVDDDDSITFDHLPDDGDDNETSAALGLLDDALADTRRLRADLERSRALDDQSVSQALVSFEESLVGAVTGTLHETAFQQVTGRLSAAVENWAGDSPDERLAVLQSVAGVTLELEQENSAAARLIEDITLAESSVDAALADVLKELNALKGHIPEHYSARLWAHVPDFYTRLSNSRVRLTQEGRLASGWKLVEHHVWGCAQFAHFVHDRVRAMHHRQNPRLSHLQAGAHASDALALYAAAITYLEDELYDRLATTPAPERTVVRIAKYRSDYERFRDGTLSVLAMHPRVQQSESATEMEHRISDDFAKTGSSNDESEREINTSGVLPWDRNASTEGWLVEAADQPLPHDAFQKSAEAWSRNRLSHLSEPLALGVLCNRHSGVPVTGLIDPRGYYEAAIDELRDYCDVHLLEEGFRVKIVRAGKVARFGRWVRRDHRPADSLVVVPDHELSGPLGAEFIEAWLKRIAPSGTAVTVETRFHASTAEAPDIS